MNNIDLDTNNLEFICDDEGGKYKWFYDPKDSQYICLNSGSRTYTYKIPVDQFCTEEEFVFRKMRRFVKDGFNKFIPVDHLRKISAPKSSAVLKLCQHKEALLKRG